jgi:hypothetical protein
VVPYRNDASARQVALYGVHADAIPSIGAATVDDWDETAVEFAAMPALIFDEDSTTQGIDPSKTTALGQITYKTNAKGQAETFSDPAIAAFLRNYPGQRVTFLLAAAPGFASTGQGRIASKEAASLDGGSPAGAPGDFAPRLNLQTTIHAALRITSVARQGEQLLLTWWGGRGPYAIQTKASLSEAWTDALAGINGTNATFDLSGPSAFFRVSSP